jgi:hypothetical protein
LHRFCVLEVSVQNAHAAKHLGTQAEGRTGFNAVARWSVGVGLEKSVREALNKSPTISNLCLNAN